MTAPVVKLGYSIPSAALVEIPLKHMVITGQTQEAGKTTALEALIHRTSCPALTFVTKRGEGSFTTGRRIKPYLKTRGDWQYVASILEASRGEKLKFERAWIIRASKGATDLDGVHRNVKRALADPKTKGLSSDVYLVLDAYLDVVVPEMRRHLWADDIVLDPGLNVMDLTELSSEMQHLVIASAIELVQSQENDTLVVIPEAWKFLPQSRGTPAKVAAVSFIRQAAAMRNYLWLDSQDLGGIEKEVLRSVSVWLLGVQRETNEIKRTLENIPAGMRKPKAADLAGLGIGQFYACWKQEIIKTFVQPKWGSAAGAQEVAGGRLDLYTYQQSRPKQETAPMATDQQYATLLRENDQLKNEIAYLTEALRGKPAPVKEHMRVPDIVNPAGIPAVMDSRLAGQDPLDAPRKPMKIDVDHVVNEIQVTHTIETIQQSTGDLAGRCAYAIAQGEFNEPLSASALKGRWDKRQWVHDYRNIEKVLLRLVEQGFLLVASTAPIKFIVVPGMKIHIKEAVR